MLLIDIVPVALIKYYNTLLSCDVLSFSCTPSEEMIYVRKLHIATMLVMINVLIKILSVTSASYYLEVQFTVYSYHKAQNYE